MASTRDLRAWLEHRAADYAEELDLAAPTLLDYVCYRVAGGESLRQISGEMGAECNRAVPTAWLASYLRRQFHDYEIRIREARRLGAFALVEEALHLIENAEETPEGLRKAQLQADVRKWQAERYARDDFGPAARATVNLNVGTLHLDALRRREAIAQLPSPEAA